MKPNSSLAFSKYSQHLRGCGKCGRFEHITCRKAKALWAQYHKLLSKEKRR